MARTSLLVEFVNNEPLKISAISYLNTRASHVGFRTRCGRCRPSCGLAQTWLRITRSPTPSPPPAPKPCAPERRYRHHSRRRLHHGSRSRLIPDVAIAPSAPCVRFCWSAKKPVDPCRLIPCRLLLVDRAMGNAGAHRSARTSSMTSVALTKILLQMARRRRATISQWLPISTKSSGMRRRLALEIPHLQVDHPLLHARPGRRMEGPHRQSFVFAFWAIRNQRSPDETQRLAQTFKNPAPRLTQRI